MSSRTVTEEEAELRAPYPSWDAFVVAFDVIRRRSGTSVDVGVLQEWGISKSNAQKTLPALKFLGIVDQNGNPLPLWAELSARDEQRYRKALEAMLRQAYRKLLDAYPDAFSETDDRLADAIGDVYKTSSSSRPVAVSFLRRMLEEAGLRASAAPPKAQPSAKRLQRSRKPVAQKTESKSVPPTRGTYTGEPAVSIHVHFNVTPDTPETQLVDLFRKVGNAKKTALVGNGSTPSA